MSNNIMQGLRVVELGTHVAIPYATRVLGDWGAEVIKIEPPTGEFYRGFGRLVRLPYDEENNVIFTPYNINKKSLCLNLKSQESVDILYKIFADTDVFATNTRPAALDRMGLNLDTLKEKFPRLIILHLNSFGEKGAEKDRPGYDSAAFWSRSGAVSEWTATEDRPFLPFYGFGDAITSSQLLTGVLSALYNREKTGKGDLVRVSLMATGMWTNVAGIIRGQDVCFAQPPMSRYEPLLPINNFYKTKDDRWIVIAEDQWEKKCDTYFDIIGKPEYKGDPEFCTIMGSIINASDLVKLLDEGIARHTSDELKEILTSINTVHEFVRNPQEIYQDKQAWENDFLREVETVGGTKFVIPNHPVVFESQGLADSQPAPLLGENTEDVLRSLGYTPEQISALKENGSVVAR